MGNPRVTEVAKTAAATRRRNRDTLVKVDGRTREARLMRETRAELTAHVGGSPTIAQRALIEQATNLRLRIAVLDKRFADSREYSEADTRTYTTLSNALGRVLSRLGLDAAPAPVKTLAQHLAEKAATRQ
jgi:hypothetical protein